MKRQLFLAGTLLVTIISLSSFSGGKCKFDYNKEDKFTGGVIKYSTYEFEHTKFRLGSNSGQLYIYFEYAQEGEMRDILTTSDTSLIKLENGKVIKIIPNENCKSIPYVATVGVWTYWGPTCNISNKLMKILSESPIVALKLKVAGKDFIVDVKKSKASKIMETAACLITEE
jgi:hypothetical protein